MTRRGRAITLFPLLALALGGAATIQFVRQPSIGALAAAIFAWYFLPPLCFRLHDRVCPLRPGREDLSDGGRYSPWWGSQQFQILYALIPQLEILLRLVPGAYSAWLRLWGSKIGHGVFWAPVLDVIDRSLLDIGNGVFFGHRVSLCGHTVLPKAGRQMLFVARVRVGDGAFISGACALGLGARVAAGEFVPLESILYFNRRLK
jgi:hypothetical protein